MCRSFSSGPKTATNAKNACLPNHFCLEIEHFSDCVLNGTAPALSFDDAKANCQVIVAALQSAAQGRVIRLDK